MRLVGLAIADEPALWVDLGFAVADGRFEIGGVTIELAGREAGEGILGWSVAGLRSAVLPECPVVSVTGAAGHPNGVTGIDHVVALAGDLDATMAALESDGLKPRRVREA